MLSVGVGQIFTLKGLAVAGVLAEVSVNVDIDQTRSDIIACRINDVRVGGELVHHAADLALIAVKAGILPLTTSPGSTIFPFVMYGNAISCSSF